MTRETVSSIERGRTERQVRAEDEALQAVVEAGHVALVNVIKLAGYAQDDRCVTAAPTASTMLGIIGDRAVGAAGRRTSPAVPRHAHAGGRVERLDRTLNRLRLRWVRKARPARWVRRCWTVVGLAASAAAAVLIAENHYVGAAVLVSARIVVSVRLGRNHDLPFEGYNDDDRQSWVVWRAVAGHVGDSAILVGVMWNLLEGHRPVWVLGAAGAVIVMLAATMARMAALQVGVQIERITTERVARLGGLVLGLVCAAVLQPAVPLEHPPVLALTFMGSLVFGMAEMFRTNQWLRLQSHPPQAVNISVSRPEGVTVLQRFSMSGTSAHDTTGLAEVVNL